MSPLLQITFPKSEWDDIKTRLSEGKVVYTIRASDEYGKFCEGDILMTEWGLNIKILSVKKVAGGIKELQKEYPYFSQLTNEMTKELKPFQNMEVISLSAVK